MSAHTVSPRSSWLTTHLLADPEGVAAHAAAHALGRAVFEEMVAAGDRLAATSVLLAQQYYRHAAAARRAFGADGFRRWVELGERLAIEEPPCREGAAAFFAVPPSAFGPGGVDRAASWWELGRDLSRTSRKLAATFFATTASVLHRADGLSRLHAWVDVARDLYAQHGWRGEFFAHGFASAAPRALVVLPPSAYRIWAGIAVALSPAVREKDVFTLPRALRRWTDIECEVFLRCVLVLATESPQRAYVFYRDLPASLQGVEPSVRSSFLGVLSQAGKRLSSAVTDLVPVAGALLQQIPATERHAALRLAEELAARFPEMVVAMLRALPRVYEEASPERVQEWFASGLEVARQNADAGFAYFALESRTSIKVLRAASTAVALEEAHGLLRKYIQMMSGAPVSVRGIEGVRLRPPLEEFPAENEVALPLRVDWLPTHEGNLRLYRFLAAQLAGRREFGTYAFVPPGGAAGDAETDGTALWRYLEDEQRPPWLEELFLLAEGVRVHHRLCGEYAGLAAEGRWVGRALSERLGSAISDDHSDAVLDAAFAVVLSGGGPAEVPAWLGHEALALILRLVAPLSAAETTVSDSMRIAHALAAALSVGRSRGVRAADGDSILLDKVTGDALIDPYYDEDGLPNDGEARRQLGGQAQERTERPAQELPLALDPDDQTPGGAQPMSPEELKRLLEAGVHVRITQGKGEEVDGVGLYITDLMGKIPSEQIEELRRLLGDPDATHGRGPKRWLAASHDGPSFYYDEWDYHIGDYRSRWCRLHEVNVDEDSGEFFTRALTDYARLIPEIRRQFQRIRPEMYRTVKGLEDGEDFDLNAVIDARIEVRAGRPSAGKFYLARKREQRDVAALFLLDMSASTDEPLAWPEAGDEGGRTADARRLAKRTGRRIIDVTKEALIIMTAALEEIGDAYAIYGFSGHGRDNVEFYRVKSFAEPLSTSVKGRMGGIEPKRSTRMGAALRHAVERMSAVSSRSKHLFLLSDGFPQDYDYGQDRRSNVYGIRDTAVALREAEAAGITPFCITVDKAGHDYLREMCDASCYMVIDDIVALPRELPKIYQRVVRG